MIDLARKTFLLMAVSLPAPACAAGPVKHLLDELAASQQLEAVHGDAFPEYNPYVSYGSPYVFDFVIGVENSVLFLARKRNQNQFCKDEISNNNDDNLGMVLRLVRCYDYFLIFAIKDKEGDSFEVKDVLDGHGLKGMSLYHGNMDLSGKEFKFVDSGKKTAGSELDRRKLSSAVLISAISSTMILFYYDGAWIEYVESDW